MTRLSTAQFQRKKRHYGKLWLITAGNVTTAVKASDRSPYAGVAWVQALNHLLTGGLEASF